MTNHFRLLLVPLCIAIGACTMNAPSEQGNSSSSAISAAQAESSSVSSSMEQSSKAFPKAPPSSQAPSSATSPSVSSAVVSSQAPLLRRISISAKNWEFSPAVIRVKKGERIQLVVTSMEGMHGFAIPGLRINEHLDAGSTIVIDLPTDTAGTFDFLCSIPCGPGHSKMRGQIIIE